jgi:membrane associated rhomboid family serine protease
MDDRISAEAQEEPSEAVDLIESGRRAIRKEARGSFLLGGGIVLLHLVLLGFSVIGLRDVFRSILFVLGLAIIAEGVWELRRARNLTLEDLKPTEQEKDFAESLRRTKPVYTWIILACLIAVGICQPVFESKESIEAAGLVKDAVRQGEWWRLLTCATLHVNFVHILMNGQALFGLGRLMESVASHYHLCLSFLLSAVCGSLFSLLLLPNTNSAGASGGLMGLIGFLAVLGYRRKGNLPRGFFKSIVINICFIGVIGVIGFAIIDNAAHLGGLIAGAIYGALMIKGYSQEMPVETGAAVRVLGLASLLAIAGISLFSILKIFHVW